MNINNYIILGTAGHIDHGKSSLIKALTGIDPDRLKEEKERGMTIDLGFANLKYPDGLTIGIVDVPGHEKLIKNMLAGAGCIDVVLFVIAADEGIMPQTKEHFYICELLDIKSGLIAITKIDLVDDEWLGLVYEEVNNFVKGSFLEGKPIISVSSKTMLNIDLLKEEIRNIALSIKPKSTNGFFRLPIDRVFSLKGHGTIVTGTALSGKISVNDFIEILPSNRKCRVKSLHSHGRNVENAYAGQRVAINLQGIDKEEIQRGDVALTPDKFRITEFIDGKLYLLRDCIFLKNREIVNFYTGTICVPARLVIYGKDKILGGDSCYCQFRLMRPVVAMTGDRYILRRQSPLETIGGGEILDSHSFKMSHKKALEELKVLDEGDLSEKLEIKIKRQGANGIDSDMLKSWINHEISFIDESLERLKSEGLIIDVDGILYHIDTIKRFEVLIKDLLLNYHEVNPLKTGMPKEELRAKLKIEKTLFNYIINNCRLVKCQNKEISLSTFNVKIERKDLDVKNKILDILSKDGFNPPNKEQICHILNLKMEYFLDIINIMVKEGTVIKVNDSLIITKETFNTLIDIVKRYFEKKEKMSVLDFKEQTGIRAKYAISYLDYLDSLDFTKRVGDVRIMKNRL